MARILLVEDNPDDRDLMLRALGRRLESDQVVTADSGDEALRLLLPEGGLPSPANGSQLALIILDLKLPGIDGLEVLEHLRSDSRTRRIPVVILTTSDDESDLKASYNRGANSYLCKPVDYTQFTELVAQLEHYWLSMNRTAP